MEENFDRLQRLLSLKRYEQPPPGYFQNFSSKVIARIESAEALEPVSWWQRLGWEFNFKPAIVCGLGVVVCGLLSAGVITSVYEGASHPVPGLNAMAPVSAPTFSPFAASIGEPVQPSTQPVFPTTPLSEFPLRAEPVSFQPGK